MYLVVFWIALFCRDDLRYWWCHPAEVPVELCLKFSPCKESIEGAIQNLRKDYRAAKERGDRRRMVSVSNIDDGWRSLRLAYSRNWKTTNNARTRMDLYLEARDAILGIKRERRIDPNNPCP